MDYLKQRHINNREKIKEVKLNIKLMSTPQIIVDLEYYKIIIKLIKEQHQINLKLPSTKILVKKFNKIKKEMI